MHLNQLIDHVFSQPSKIKVLRFLAWYPGWYSGREIARSVNLSHPVVHSALYSLEEEGIILLKKAGVAHLYTLNQKSWLVEHFIVPIFDNERNFLPIFLQSITEKISSYITSVILYGSMARKSETPRSDIDLLVVTPDKNAARKVEREFEHIIPDAAERVGNQISPLIFTRKEFVARVQKKDSFLQQVLKESKVIKGKSVSEIIRQKKK